MRYKKIIPNAKVYTFTKAKLSLPETNPTVPNVFNGKLVYLGFKDYGFQPMIKVLDVDTSESLFFFPKDVMQIDINENFNYGVNNLPKTTHVKSVIDYGFGEMQELYPQYSAANGTNTQVGEFSASDVEQKYQQSGSKLSFGDWLKSDQGKKLVNDSLTLAFSLLNKNNNNTNTANPTEGNNNNNNTHSDKGFEILNMKPLTFALVSIGTITAIVLAIKYIPKITKKTI